MSGEGKTHAHACPGPECDEFVAVNFLACRGHWAQVPGPVKRAVYAAWDHGNGRGSDAHIAAMAAAVRSMRPIRRRDSGQ